MIEGLRKLKETSANPYNMIVQVYCFSLQVKEQRYWLFWSRGTMEKAKQRATTVKYWDSVNVRNQNHWVWIQFYIEFSIVLSQFNSWVLLLVSTCFWLVPIINGIRLPFHPISLYSVFLFWGVLFKIFFVMEKIW